MEESTVRSDFGREVVVVGVKCGGVIELIEDRGAALEDCCLRNGLGSRCFDISPFDEDEVDWFGLTGVE